MVFHFSELSDAQPQKKPGDSETKNEAGPIEPGVAPEQTPAKSINNADHRIEGIDQTPLVRDNAGTESNRRHIEAQLHNERDNVAKIPILDVERGDPHAHTQAGHERNAGEHRQQQNLPARHKLVPDHQSHEDRKADKKVHEGDLTAAIGTINRGKYTLLMRLALPMRLFDVSVSAVAKKL